MIEATKANKAGDCTVYVEVSVSKLGEKKKTVRIPTNIKVSANNWSAKSQTVIRGKSNTYYKINQTLTAQKESVNEIIAELTDKGTFQLEEIKQRYLEKTAPVTIGFFDIYDDFLQTKKQQLTHNGIKDYKTLRTHLVGFEKYRRNSIIISQVDNTFFEKFQVYLSKLKIEVKVKDSDEVKTKLYADSTIQKNLQTLRLFLNYQLEKGLPINKNYKKFKIGSKPEIALITLEPEEYKLLLLPIENERLENVRKLFVLQCSTGLRFSDMIKITKSHVRNNTIYMNSTKTRQKLQIPLNANSLEILKQCDFDTSKIAISNQKYNDYIKELCELVGINQDIMKIGYRGNKEVQEQLKKHDIMSSHHGRRFFITQNLLNGIRPEVIMSMTGHTDFRSFKKYIALTDITRINAMELWSKTFGSTNSKV
jgi:site-specific recombinase XerD